MRVWKVVAAAHHARRSIEPGRCKGVDELGRHRHTIANPLARIGFPAVYIQ